MSCWVEVYLSLKDSTCVCVCVGGVRAHVCALRKVSRDKMLRFKNTLIISSSTSTAQGHPRFFSSKNKRSQQRSLKAAD